MHIPCRDKTGPGAIAADVDGALVGLLQFTFSNVPADEDLDSVRRGGNQVQGRLALDECGRASNLEIGFGLEFVSASSGRFEVEK